MNGRAFGVWASHTLPANEIEFRLNRLALRHDPIRALWAELTRHSLPFPAKIAPSAVNYLLPSIHPRAGMGHRVSSWISGFLFAQDYGLTLLHYPWRDGWDRHLGLDTSPLWRPNLGRITPLPPLQDELDAAGRNLHRKILAAKSAGTVYRLAIDQHRFDQSPAFREVQDRYWARRGARQGWTDVRVAVHVRRGDVGVQSRDRYRGQGYFQRQLDSVLTVLRSFALTSTVTIHSQDRVDLQVPASIRVTRNIAGDQYATFDAMADSQILICSPSSYSVTAGMVSGGVVLRPKKWFHAFPSEARWVGVDIDGVAPPDDLRRAVLNLLHETAHNKGLQGRRLECE